MSTKDASRILDCHLTLGSKKPVSYLPIKTIEKVIGISVSEYVLLVERMGNTALVFSEGECCIESGAVYAYSYDDLAEVLAGSEQLLVNCKWPRSPVEFIRKVASGWVDEDKSIVSVIRKAFGDV